MQSTWLWPLWQALVLSLAWGFTRRGKQRFVQWVTGQNLWDPQVRFLTELPAKTDPVEVSAIVLMALFLSFLATLIPAWRASKTDPVQVLRYE